MDFGILMVFWYVDPLQFQNENASILIKIRTQGTLPLAALSPGAGRSVVGDLENPRAESAIFKIIMQIRASQNCNEFKWFWKNRAAV